MQRIGPTVTGRAVVHPLLWLALGWLAVSDLPTGWRLGPLSVSGAATLVAGLAAVALAPALVLRGRGRSAPRSWRFLIPPGRRAGVVPWPLTLFCVVAVAGALRSPSVDALQQVAVYCAFAGAIAVGALYSEPGTAARFLRALGVVMGALAILAVPLYALGLTLLGNPRSFALTALVATAALVPVRSDHRLVRLAPVLLTIAIAATLSRTALVIAVLLLAFSVLRSRRGFRGLRIALALAGLAAAAVIAFVTVPSLRNRFTQGDGVDIGGIALNTSGRSQIWDVVVRSASERPWLGHGAGTASQVVAARYPFVGQPHNDYLRVWHDFGLLGLGLFVLALVALIGGAVGRARRAGPEHRAVHWSAALAAASVAVAAATDNPLVYPFVMVPLGALLGISIARRDLDRAAPVHRGRARRVELSAR